MSFLKKLLKEGTEAAATVIAHAVVTGADIIENAEEKRTELGRKFEQRAQRAAEKVERTRENLANAFEQHVTAFADALDTALGEIEEEHRAASEPAPKATVAEATTATVTETKPGLKTPPAPEAPAAEAPKAKTPRKRKPRQQPRKPSR